MQGTAADLIISVVMIFVASVAILAGSTVTDSLRSTLGDNASINVTYIERGQDAFTAFNNTFSFFVIVGLGIGIVILGLSIRTHPALAIASIIALIIIIWLAAMFGNFYQDIGENPSLAASANKLGILSFVWENITTIIIVMGIMLFLALYAKGGDVGGT